MPHNEAVAPTYTYPNARVFSYAYSYSIDKGVWQVLALFV